MPDLSQLLEMTPERIQALVREEAIRQGVDPEVAVNVARIESGYKPGVLSPKGAAGVMQLMPGTARMLGVNDVADPVANIRGGVTYLRQLAGMFPGRPDLQVAAYQAGPERVKRRGAPLSSGDGIMSNVAYVGAVLGPRAAHASASPQSGAPQDLNDILNESTAAPRQDLNALLNESTAAAPTPPSTPVVGAAPTPPSTPVAGAAAPQSVTMVDEPSPLVNDPLLRQQGVTVKEAQALDQEALRALGYDFGLIQQSKAYEPGMFAALATHPMAEQSGVAPNLAHRAFLGLFGAFMKGGALVTTGLSKLGLASEADVALANAYQSGVAKLRDRVAQQSVTGAGFAAETVGNILLPLPGVPTWGPVARAALQGALGGALQPSQVTQGQSIVPSTVQQATLGGALGGGVAAVVQGAARLPAILPGVRRAGQVSEDIAANRAAAGRLSSVPETYASSRVPAIAEQLATIPETTGTPFQRLMGAFRREAGDATVSRSPLLARLREVDLDMPSSPLEAEGVRRLIGSLREGPPTIGVTELAETLPDLVRLMRSSDGKIRHAAGAAMDAVDAALEQFAGPAVGYLRAARTAFRRDAAVETLENALRYGGPIIRRRALANDTIGPEIDVNAALTLVDRLSQRHRYFQGAFTPEELAALQGSADRVVGTPRLPKNFAMSLSDLARDILLPLGAGAAVGHGGRGAAIGAGIALSDAGARAVAQWLLQPEHLALLGRLRAQGRATLPLSAIPVLGGAGGVAGGRLGANPAEEDSR